MAPGFRRKRRFASFSRPLWLSTHPLRDILPLPWSEKLEHELTSLVRAESIFCSTQACFLCKMDRKMSDYPKKPIPTCSHQAVCIFCLERHVHMHTFRLWTSCPVADCKNITGIPPNLMHKINNYPLPLDSTRKPREFECKVCFEKLPFSKFPRTGVSAVHCNHPSTVCFDCLNLCIAAAVEESHEPQCPECPAVLSNEDIRQLSSLETLHQYQQKAYSAQMPVNSSFRMCLSERCGHGQVHEAGSEDPVVVCTKCSGKTCFKHAIPWHEGLTCDEYDFRERDNTKLLEEISQPCPSCGVRIQRTGGCAAMKCNICRYQFRWIENPDK